MPGVVTKQTTPVNWLILMAIEGLCWLVARGKSPIINIKCSSVIRTHLMSVSQLSVIFFLQMFVILATCRVVGWLGKKYFNQPQVVGEMIAGVILGPSLFGLLAPETQQMIFPEE